MVVVLLCRSADGGLRTWTSVLRTKGALAGETTGRDFAYH